MRIWIVNHYALPPGASGGPTRHLGLARALRDRGHEVVIHASVYDHYTRSDHRPRGANGHVVDEIDGITYVWWSSPPYGSTLRRIRNMASFAWQVARRGAGAGLPAPQVVIGSSPHLLAAWAAQRLARRNAVPFVFEVRDLWPQTFVDMGELSARHPATLLLRRLESFLYRKAARVITVPPLAANYIESRGADPRAIVHIPNGVDLRDPAVDRSRRRADRFTVVYAGTLGHANGLEIAIDAWTELERRGRRDIRLRLVGAGPERARLREANAACPHPHVTIEEAVPSTEVPSLLATADASLLILRDSPVFRWGVSPTKLFDYLAAGLPVIASVSAPDLIVGPAGAGVWVGAGDALALADAVEQLADAPPEARADMGKRGRHYVEEHHGFDVLAAEMEAVLLDAVRGAT